jgi:general secretion pathway protein H
MPTGRMTISATGDARGFTLLEILLALALIALLATVFVGASSALLADRPRSLDDQFWKLCGEARRSALEHQHDLEVSFDPRTRSFVLSDGTSARSIPVTGPADLAVDFLAADREASTILIGGTLIQTTPLPAVTFYADGTCTPFRVQFRANGAAHTLELDPWTCAPVLPPVDARP